LAAPLALRTGAFNGEEALRRAHAPGARAHGAGDRLRARLGARARTVGAGDGGRHADLRGAARIGLLQRDLHVVAQVGAALAPARRAAAAAHHVAEDVLEDVGEPAVAETMVPPAHALLESGVAEAVVGGALLR